MRAIIALALATALVAACGGENPTAPSSTPVPGPSAPTPTTGSLMVRLQASQPVSGVSVAIAGPVQQSRMTNAPGSVMFSDIALGEYTVTARGAGYSATQTTEVVSGSQQNVTLELRGTPWSELPPISEAEKQFITTAVLNRYRGVVRRWADGIPIRVYAVSALDRADVLGATQRWNRRSRGKINYQIVDTPGEAQIVIDVDSSVLAPNTCGRASTTRFDGDTTVAGVIHLEWNNPSMCDRSTAVKRMTVIAHELGHVLELGDHAPAGTDIMSSPNSVWVDSLLIDNSLNWLYDARVQPGTRPE